MRLRQHVQAVKLLLPATATTTGEGALLTWRDLRAAQLAHCRALRALPAAGNRSRRVRGLHDFKTCCAHDVSSHAASQCMTWAAQRHVQDSDVIDHNLIVQERRKRTAETRSRLGEMSLPDRPGRSCGLTCALLCRRRSRSTATAAASATKATTSATTTIAATAPAPRPPPPLSDASAPDARRALAAMLSAVVSISGGAGLPRDCIHRRGAARVSTGVTQCRP